LYAAPIQQRKAGPHPSVEGRGSQPRFHVEEIEERRQRQRWWWETRGLACVIAVCQPPFINGE